MRAAVPSVGELAARPHSFAKRFERAPNVGARSTDWAATRRRFECKQQDVAARGSHLLARRRSNFVPALHPMQATRSLGLQIGEARAFACRANPKLVSGDFDVDFAPGAQSVLLDKGLGHRQDERAARLSEYRRSHVKPPVTPLLLEYRPNQTARAA